MLIFSVFWNCDSVLIDGAEIKDNFWSCLPSSLNQLTGSTTISWSKSYMHKGQGKGGKSEFSPPQKISGKFVPPSQGSFPPSFFLPPFWILGIFSPPVWVLASKSTRKTSKFTKKRGGKIFLPPKNSWKIFPRGKGYTFWQRPYTQKCRNQRIVP